MKPEEENMTRTETLHSLLGKLRADIDRVPTSLSASTLMTYSRTLTSTARTGMPVTEDTLMNTLGPTRSLTADIKGTFKEVLERASLMRCSKT